VTKVDVCTALKQKESQRTNGTKEKDPKFRVDERNHRKNLQSKPTPSIVAQQGRKKGVRLAFGGMGQEELNALRLGTHARHMRIV